MTTTRKAVLVAALSLFLVWLIGNFSRIMEDQDGLIRFVLGLLFAVLIMLRWKPATDARSRPGWLLAVLGAAGAGTAVVGMIVPVHQFAWLGLIVLLYACLRWALPPRFSRDTGVALLLLYWIHPLPSQALGSLQLAMQQLSVAGAEWLLHCLNVRVWADGMILRMGFREFGVPEACSGMRTAVTVLICTLGVGALMRLKWYEILVLMVAGLFQVLVLNVLRIAFMVYWSPRMPPEWAENFLHDSLAAFLFVSILLVQLEASWWKVRKVRRKRIEDGRERGELESPDYGTTVPSDWRAILRVAKWTILAGILLGGGAFAVYKHRPFHRSEMIAGTVDSLIESDPENAERAADASLALNPGNREMRAKRLHILLIRNKFDEAEAALQGLPPPLSMEEKVLTSWTLMAVNRGDEALALLDTLPEGARHIPEVAVIRAECAMRQGHPDVAAEYAPIAARGHTTVQRARALFPFLAAHEQWQAIADCDHDAPFPSIGPTLLAIHANLLVGDLLGAEQALRMGLDAWPDDPRFLTSLNSLAAARPEGPWEMLYANILDSNLQELDPDQLASHLRYAFGMRRPDLGWRIYRRLRELDAEDPDLYLAPAQYGTFWFSFRQRRLGLKAASAAETINLRDFYLQTRTIPPFSDFWAAVPLASELGTGDVNRTRGRFLEMGLRELATRDAENTLTPRMEQAYPVALGMAGRYDEAHVRLDALARKYPDAEAKILLQHASFYDQEQKWEPMYEALLRYRQVQPRPDLTADLFLIRALLRLNLGMCAMHAAEEAQARYPGSVRVTRTIAAIQAAFGYFEEALFTLGENALAEHGPVVAQLLYDTRRYRDAEQVASSLGVELRRRPLDEEQHLFVKPAEHAVMRRWPEPLSEAEMDAEAAVLRELREQAQSQFLRELHRLKAEWYEGRGRGAVSDIGAWREIGRNAMEQSAALGWLTILLARQQQYEQAEAAAREAVRVEPRSAVLRRVLVGLTEGERQVVEEAYRTCPKDPELWLAWLVVRLREEGAGDWVGAAMEQAIADRRYSVGTFVRAGDFLLRQGQAEPAAAVARYTVANSRGFLPAYTLGLRCALRQRDREWALKCALGGAEKAIDPVPFYRAVVDVKSIGRDEVDADMIASLQYLQETFPEEPHWTEKLGFAYFKQRDAKRAWTVLEPVVQEDMSGVRLQSLLLAAEAARVAGKADEAVTILETAHSLHPEELSVLNNLVYNLAQSESTLARARELLPKLLEQDSDSFNVLDTAAVIYMKSGDLQKARYYMQRALKALEHDDYSAPEVNLNAAALLFHMGEYEGARGRLEQIREYSDRFDVIDIEARELLREIDEKEREKRVQ